MILYFLRHGLAGDRETWHEDDSLRPLTEQGKKNLLLEAKTITALALELNYIITSPLVRAAQTAEIVARQLGMQRNLIEDSRLSPGFGIAELTEIVKDYRQTENLMLVGHEPDFSQVISELTGGSRLVMKKAGLARVDVYNFSPLAGELVWLIPPKVLIV